MAYFPQPHPSQRARRYRVCERTHIQFIYGEGQQVNGRLHEISKTGGSADMEATLPASTLVHMTVRAQTGPIAAVAEMLPLVSGHRQPFRFIALDERDRDTLQRLISD
jgi:hypothetical protein